MDEPIAPTTLAVLEEAGVYTNGHRARQVNESMLEEADLVLAINPRHIEKLRSLSATSSEKIHILPGYTNDAPDWEGVPDPYGHSMTTYRASMRQIFEYVDLLLADLKSG